MFFGTTLSIFHCNIFIFVFFLFCVALEAKKMQIQTFESPRQMAFIWLNQKPFLTSNICFLSKKTDFVQLTLNFIHLHPVSYLNLSLVLLCHLICKIHAHGH